MEKYAILLVLAFVQNVSFTIVSRSRNRDNFYYHLVAAILSNGVWFLTFKQLVTQDFTFDLFIPYCIGTVSGSLCGAKISMFIERILGARCDKIA